MSDDPATITNVPTALAPGTNPDGYVAHGYDLDNGRPVFTDLPPMTGLLLVIYDGDDGTMVHAAVVRPDSPATAAVVPFVVKPETLSGVAKQIAVERLEATLAECTGDPDRPCPICDDTVPDGAMIDRGDCHRECQLAYMIGWYGHHLDCEFWCKNVGDPHAGLSVRESALRVAALVEQHGIIAVIEGTFKQDEKAP